MPKKANLWEEKKITNAFWRENKSLKKKKYLNKVYNKINTVSFLRNSDFENVLIKMLTVNKCDKQQYWI